MRQLFTKRFLDAPLADQGQVVDAVLDHLEEAATYDATGRVKNRIRRIIKMAVIHGIYTEAPCHE
jgi:hypothetical protein